MLILSIILLLLLLLDIASLYYGYDSRDGLDSPEWERRNALAQKHWEQVSDDSTSRQQVSRNDARNRVIYADEGWRPVYHLEEGTFKGYADCHAAGESHTAS